MAWKGELEHLPVVGVYPPGYRLLHPCWVYRYAGETKAWVRCPELPPTADVSPHAERVWRPPPAFPYAGGRKVWKCEWEHLPAVGAYRPGRLLRPRPVCQYAGETMVWQSLPKPLPSVGACPRAYQCLRPPPACPCESGE